MGGYSSLLFSVFLSWNLLIMCTHELQPSQTQVVLQLRKLLEYPKALEIWSNKTIDFCYVSSQQANLSCENNYVTELKILGDKPKKANNLGDHQQTLSQNFSMDSFLATLSRLNNLRVLSMVSLGIWGPLPSKIYRLYSLEYLDLSSNFFYGNVPQQISRMATIRTLVMDGNFLNGSFPNVFDSFKNLTNLSLRDNRLSGELPSSLAKAKNLNVIAFSNNELSGKLPDLSSLSSLQVLDLSNNKLGPEIPKLPKGLIMAFLNNNSFSSETRGQFSQLSQLQHLDLSSNSLNGTPPFQLFSLPNISSLNLGSNMLSGSFPKNLKCGSQLRFIDISNNKIIGNLPSCLSNASSNKIVKYDGNCLSSVWGNQHEAAFCLVAAQREENEEKASSKGKSVAILAAVIGGILVILALLSIGLVALFRRYCPRGSSEQHLLHKPVQDNPATVFSTGVLTRARFISEASKLGTEGMPLCRLFTYEELTEATNNFDKCTILGEGTYGKLYKGKLGNGTEIVIRCLTVSKKYTIRNLKLRLDLLAKLRHQHLVCLLGHCIENGGRDANQVFLIYEYVSNGNYRAHLSESNQEKGLKWCERLSALTGVAKAVHFLHTGVIPGFFNNRLKTHNILLNEHRMAKLSDYGLSIVAEDIDNTKANGDDLNSWQMKSLDDDVYNFGFILLESLIGSPVSSRTDSSLLNDMVSLGSQDGRRRLVDPIVLGSSSQESLSIVIDLVSKCISPDSSTRPSFEDILWNLQYAAQIQTSTNSGEQRFESFSRS